MRTLCRTVSLDHATLLREAGADIVNYSTERKHAVALVELKHAAPLVEAYTQAKHVTEVKRTGAAFDARRAAELRASSRHMRTHMYMCPHTTICVSSYCYICVTTQALSSTRDVPQSCERVRDILKIRRKRKLRIRRARIRMRPVRIRQVRISRACTQSCVLRRKSWSKRSMKKASTRQSVSIGSCATSRLWYSMF